MAEVKSVTFAYVEDEDRLRLDMSDGVNARTLLLTRRIMRRLLHAFANALVSSSRSVSRAPAEARREVFVLEHLSSLAADVGAPATEPGPSSPAQAAPAHLGQELVTRVDARVEPQTFRLSFHGVSGHLAMLELTRRDFHRFLSALDRAAQAAEWDIHQDAGWLNGAESIAASTSGRQAS